MKFSKEEKAMWLVYRRFARSAEQLRADAGQPPLFAANNS
jgi:hypothetical protein